MDTCNAKNQAKTQKNDYEWTTSKSVCHSFSPDVALLGRTPILSSRAPTSDKKKATACHQKRLSQIWCWATTFCVCVVVFVCLYLCVFTNMVLIPSSPIRCPVIIGLVLRSVTTYNYLMSIQMICLLIVCSNVPSDAEIEPSLYLLSLCICKSYPSQRFIALSLHHWRLCSTDFTPFRPQNHVIEIHISL